jgi:3-oxoadipate enol-lactonase
VSPVKPTQIQDEVRLHHRRLEGDGPDLTLIHGGFVDGATWDGVVAPLAERTRPMAIDLRGYGRSGRVSQPWTMADCAGDVADLWVRLGVARGYVVGFSQGAMVALALAVLRPSQVKGLVLVSGTACFGDDVRERWRRRAEHLGEVERDEEVVNHVRAAFSESYRQRQASAVGRYRARAGTTTPTTLRNTMLALADADCRPILPGIDCPVLVVRGEDDPIIPPSATEALVAALPRATAVVVPGVGHNVHLERPDLFVPLVLEFVDANEQGRGHGHHAE